MPTKKQNKYQEDEEDEYVEEGQEYDEVDDEQEVEEINAEDEEEGEEEEGEEEYGEDADDDEGDENGDLNDDAKKKLSATILKKMNIWMDCDDKIKEINDQVKKVNLQLKKIKQVRQENEDTILVLLEKLKFAEGSIIPVKNGSKFRGTIERCKSVTKGPINEKILKTALMQCVKDERKVDQYIKKIEASREQKEKYFLKRNKGNQKDVAKAKK
jgi:hypothetical protein